MLEVRDLTKIYPGNHGIQGLNLTVKSGEVVALLGPNGAGKTTALKAMMGLVKASQGISMFHGASILDHPETTRNTIGMMIGDPAPYPYLTGYQFLKLYSKQYTDEKMVDADQIEQRIQETLEIVGLTARQKDKIKTYSTGMKQRICLAKVLLFQPELIILDEPFSGMDIEGRNELTTLLKSIVDERHVSLIISSHLIHDIESMTTKVCILGEGQCLATESTEVIKSKYPTIEAFYLSTVGQKRSVAV